MERALKKLYSDRKELRQHEPAFLRGVAKVPVLELGELRKVIAKSKRVRLPYP